jgi:general secretion pathway protein M
MSQPLLESLLTRWAALSSRERRGLLLGAALIVLALTWALAYEPAARGRARLLADQATWQADLARMDALVAQARQLGAVTGAEAPSLVVVRDQLENTLRSAGWGTQLGALKATSELIELRMNGVAVAPWMAWLETSVRESRLRVLELSLERPGPPADPGTVNVRVVLDRPGRAR